MTERSTRMQQLLRGPFATRPRPERSAEERHDEHHGALTDGMLRQQGELRAVAARLDMHGLSLVLLWLGLVAVGVVVGVTRG